MPCARPTALSYLEQGDRSFQHKHNLEPHNREPVIGNGNIGDPHQKEEPDLSSEEVREKNQISDFDVNGMFHSSSLLSVPEVSRKTLRRK